MDGQRRWTMPPADPRAAELAQRLRTSRLVAQILLNRGLYEAEDCARFLQPQLKSLHEPALLAGCQKAAERIARAVREKQKIVIYGDYDVDGITATAILWHAIRELGHSADSYIPHRIDEGYGLSPQAVAKLCEQGNQLIITVDCGVTAIEAARVAAERGVDLIITDHHEWQTAPDGSPMLPDCHAIVHPRLSADGPVYPNPDLCGAGVALKLAWATGQAINGTSRVSDGFRALLVEAMSLAALGTVADVVPLKGENRVLAHYGLGGLAQTRLDGIAALIRAAGLDGQKIDSYHAGFLLAPRLNACGRMGHAQLAVELLTTADAARAGEIAGYLEQQNRQRQATERSILAEALEQASACGDDAPDSPCIVLSSPTWHAGVIGIVASRLVDRLHKPTVLVALGEGATGESGASGQGGGQGSGQGSGRSISGFHLAQALAACAEHLEASGGHQMAAGLRIRPEKFDGFRVAFREYARREIGPDLLVRQLSLDAEGRLEHMTDGLVNDLQRLGPFGQGNRRPLLCLRSVSLAGPPRRVGKTGDHLQFHVRQGEVWMKCIAFGAGDWTDRLTTGMSLDLAAEPQLNSYNGRTNVELQVKDLRPAMQ
jgi:single-stranded-DNA-specific exonuclease